MAKLLYIGTHGTDDPTRATFPFLMAKGAIEAGHEAGIILMGDAAWASFVMTNGDNAPGMPVVLEDGTVTY